MGAPVLRQYFLDQSRATGVVVLPAVALLYGVLALVYTVVPPLQPALPLVIVTGAAAVGFALLGISLSVARDEMVQPIVLTGAIVGVGVASSFLSITGDPPQTVVLIITLLGSAYCLLFVWTTVVTVAVGVGAWFVLAWDYPQAALTHWGLNIGSTGVLAVIVSSARARAVRGRALVEEGLRESEERHRLVVESALDAVITFDDTGEIVGWNPHAGSIFGWSAAEAIGRSLETTVIPKQHRDEFRGILHRFLEQGERSLFGRRFEVSAIDRSERAFPVEMAIVPAQQGRRYIFTAFVRDITERRQAEGALRHAKEVAEAAARTKSEFLANMSHEIRTPIHGIFGMTELALDTEDAIERNRCLHRARACAESLMTVINDILDFSRIEAGKLELQCVEYDPRAVLAGVYDTLALEADRRGLEFHCRAAERLPARMVGAPDRIRQVLINLGNNALKFTERGAVSIELVVDEVDSRMLRGTVRDTGIGIAHAKQSAIFDSFTQADASTTSQYGGTGLGLAISKRLVSLMGGAIGLESVPGQGSTFWFTVRAERSLDAAAAAAPTMRPGSVAPAGLD